MTITEILKALDKCNFYHLTEGNFEEKIVDNLGDELSTYNCGASKGVLFFEDTDFVIKIPFAGSECPQEEYDEENDEYYETGDYIFSSFQFADDNETGDDYCLAELIRYDHALDYDDGEGKVAQLFARTEFVDFVHGYPIYKQPICEIFSHTRWESEYDEDSKSSTEKHCEDKGFDCFNSCWLSDVLSAYGQAIFDEFCTFIQEEDIKDLHSSNIGYKDGLPIIFDYSSFND